LPGYGDVAALYVLHRRLFRDRDAIALYELFREWILLPAREDRAFELLLLFRLTRQLAGAGWKQDGLRLIGAGEGPVFEFSRGASRLSVYFQGVPPGWPKASIYRAIVNATGLGASLRRPDIVVALRDAAHGERLAIIEAKCSADPQALRNAVFQLIGYAKDFQIPPDGSVALIAVGYSSPLTASHTGLVDVGGYRWGVTDATGYRAMVELAV
jgi:hypothetical protein